jgi:glyoxylase-like metal-dependent hydrolase (beta-lactamase superfamily II)
MQGALALGGGISLSCGSETAPAAGPGVAPADAQAPEAEAGAQDATASGETLTLTILVENTVTAHPPQGVDKATLKPAPAVAFHVRKGATSILYDGALGDAYAPPDTKTVLLDNASALGIDLATVGACLVSHAHYDHGDGLRYFFQKNATAVVHLQRSAQYFYYYKKEAQVGAAVYQYNGLDRALFSGAALYVFSG